MPRILILSRDKAYGRYLQNLAEQLDSKMEVRRGAPDASAPRNWKPEMIVLEQVEDSFEKTREKFGRSGEIPFLIISEDGNTGEDSGAVRTLSRPLEAGSFVQALYDHFGEERFPKNLANCDLKGLDTYAMGCSPAMEEIRHNIMRISDTNLPVLLQGETGTGKGVAARLLHSFSSRRADRYMEINCANIPQNLMESELFGHRQGAFTGAWKNRTGRFRMASGGTVFLDEISEINPLMQAKLLQVLQDGEFSPVGSVDSITVDVRILAASNADLEQMMSESLFRKDLYYRLAVITLYLPPLRKRKEDIEVLVTYFLDKYASLYNKKSIAISSRLKKLFEIHNWPGNVRELENVIKTLVALENEEQVLEDLQSKTGGNPAGEDSLFLGLGRDGQRPGLKEITGRAVARTEKELITGVLSRTGGNRKQAAGLLRVSYKSLLNKIKAYGL